MCVCMRAHVFTCGFNGVQFFSVASSLADEMVLLRNKP